MELMPALAKRSAWMGTDETIDPAIWPSNKNNCDEILLPSSYGTLVKSAKVLIEDMLFKLNVPLRVIAIAWPCI